MPFVNGVFANVTGASSAFTGAVIESSVWNNIHIDYSSAINTLAVNSNNSRNYRNALWMNGSLDVWQRGVSIAVAASSTAYTADRWYLITNANQDCTISRQDALADNSLYSARVQRDSGETGINTIMFAYPLDLDEINHLVGGLVAITMSIKAGSEFSPTGGALGISFYVGTATPIKRGTTPYTGETIVVSASINVTAGGLTNTISIISSVTIPAGSQQAELQIRYIPTSTAGTDDYFDIDDVQVEGLSNLGLPTSFDRVPLPAMINGCLLYYQKTHDYATSVEAGTGIENSVLYSVQSPSLFKVQWFLPSYMRVSPDITLYNPLVTGSTSFINIAASATETLDAVVNTSLTNSKIVTIDAAATASSTDSYYAIHADASAGI